ncbi:hypothetical protein Goari_006285 [Gossypium aridum]|uniref:Uncharacterized protein n=1 Tax=Gossypium aridum TaxID=34290 RepID=A0A7J8XMS1_GOSAI|nr:hypothetical protein [Gossypium aridum]
MGCNTDQAEGGPQMYSLEEFETSNSSTPKYEK